MLCTKLILDPLPYLEEFKIMKIPSLDKEFLVQYYDYGIALFIQWFLWRVQQTNMLLLKFTYVHKHSSCMQLKTPRWILFATTKSLFSSHSVFDLSNQWQDRFQVKWIIPRSYMTCHWCQSVFNMGWDTSPDWENNSLVMLYSVDQIPNLKLTRSLHSPKILTMQ